MASHRMAQEAEVAEARRQTSDGPAALAGEPATLAGESAALAEGPARPTLVEQALALLPLPYGWAALLVAAVLGPPGSLLVAYLESGSLATSLESFFYGYMPARGWQQILAVILWTAFYVMLFLTIRRGRRSVLKAQAALAPLLPEADRPPAAFNGLSSFIPAFVIGLAIEIFMLVDYSSRIAAAPGPVSKVYEALSGPPLYLMAGTAIWVYARAVWGLYQLGRGPLQIKPFYEDKSMGLRPLASLSLSLTATYFSLLLIMVLTLLIGPTLPQYVVVVTVLLLLGVGLFFAPLLSAHTRMKREKTALQASIKARWAAIFSGALPAPGSPGAAVLDDADMRTIVTLEALERKIAGVNTWPFDVPILSKLGVMTLSIILALITQIFKNVLGL